MYLVCWVLYGNVLASNSWQGQQRELLTVRRGYVDTNAVMAPIAPETPSIRASLMLLLTLLLLTQTWGSSRGCLCSSSRC